MYTQLSPSNDNLIPLWSSNEGENADENNNSLTLNTNNYRLKNDEWLISDINNGFIRLYDPILCGNNNFQRSKLIPCTIWTTVEQICSRLNRQLNSQTWYVQYNGDRLKHLNSYDKPLFIQYEYLLSIGFNNIKRIQQEGQKHDLGYLIRFLTGRLIFDEKLQENNLSTYVWIRKGKFRRKWFKRKCIISNCRLTIYPDANTNPFVVELNRANVEEVRLKEKPYCLKLSVDGHGSLYMALNNDEEYSQWLKRMRKTTNKVIDIADYSSSHLELIPQNLFINQALSVLNLRHNNLRLRQTEEYQYTVGWLDDICRFQNLVSLNLADNELKQFPLVICDLHRLVELNLASNRITTIAPEIENLQCLELLHLQNNCIYVLPIEIENLKRLKDISLAFNYFKEIPISLAKLTHIRCSHVTSLFLAGNHIKKITLQAIKHLEYCRQIDFRMNSLKLNDNEQLLMNNLFHLTHLDLSNNQIVSLDLRSLIALQHIRCSRNQMEQLTLAGHSLRRIHVSHNKLKTIQMIVSPTHLIYLDISSNHFHSLPEWLNDETEMLERLIADHNRLALLPNKLFTSSKHLRYVRLDHNCLLCLPDRITNCCIETLLLHHNRIEVLPINMLKHMQRLRILNLSNNQLSTLPFANDRSDLNKLQELYLTCNDLKDDICHTLSRFERLKILHLAYNRLEYLDESALSKLISLTELNLSGNLLKLLPMEALNKMENLEILCAHSNKLEILPDFRKLNLLKVLDLSFNQIKINTIENLFPSSLTVLDLACNKEINIEKQSLENLSDKIVSLVNVSSSPLILNNNFGYLPWSVGFAQSSGIRYRLSITTVNETNFHYSSHEALFAMFDGGHNNEVPLILQNKLPDVLHSEYEQCEQANIYLKHTFLTLQKRLKTTGQRLGAAATVIHIRPLSSHLTNEQANINNNNNNNNNNSNYSSTTTTSTVSSSSSSNDYRFELNVANVGHCEAVLCRSGVVHPLTRRFTLPNDQKECKRIRKTNTIINDDNLINAVTTQSRMLGCTFLYPAIIPNPNISSFVLGKTDEFFIIANNLLWQHLSHDEAVREIRQISNPILASKHLVDLAQSYGAKENLAALVVRFHFDKQQQQQIQKPLLSSPIVLFDHLQQRERRTYSASSSDHSSKTQQLPQYAQNIHEQPPLVLPSSTLFETVGYLSVNEITDDEGDEKSLINKYFYADSTKDDQTTTTISSTDAPTSGNDSIRTRHLHTKDHAMTNIGQLITSSLCETRFPTMMETESDEEKSKHHYRNNHYFHFQSNQNFNFPALNQPQTIRTVPSELTIVSEIISPSPPPVLSRTRKIKNPSIIDSGVTRSGRYRKKITGPIRPPLGYSKPPPDLSSDDDCNDDEIDYSPVFTPGQRPVDVGPQNEINESIEFEPNEKYRQYVVQNHRLRSFDRNSTLFDLSLLENIPSDNDTDDEDDTYSVLIDPLSLSYSSSTNNCNNENQLRNCYPSLSSTTCSNINSTITTSTGTETTNNKITRL